jgi:hypothetical protein
MQREPAGLRSAAPFALAFGWHALQREHRWVGPSGEIHTVGKDHVEVHGLPLAQFICV